MAYHDWNILFPTIRPFYAIKCNPDPIILQTLKELGAGFDVASGNEIREVASLFKNDAESEREKERSIIMANTCKLPKDIVLARKQGIRMLTCDSMCELMKIAKYYKKTPPKVLIRIHCGDPSALISFGNKFGAYDDEWPSLLEYASTIGIQICGVSFHVGSGCKDPSAYVYAIQQALKLMELMRLYNFIPSILDIGGGFMYPIDPKIVTAINDVLPKNDEIEIIAEPGRYFAEPACTLYTRVIGKRNRYGENAYWIYDGIYGNFADVAAGYLTPSPRAAKRKALEQCKIYGATCDGTDIVCASANLPDLEIGDWIEFKNMGAYTCVLSTKFNGMVFDHRRIYIQ